MSLPLNQDRIQELRTRLLQEKRELEARLRSNEHYQLSTSMRDSLDELSLYDNHPADVGTEMFERGKDVALVEREEIRLKRIDSALARMETGEYGICRECGVFISPERMDAMPTAEYCLEHEPRQDTSARRPVEERFLKPPFGRTDMDDTSQTAFDGEDAWQAVASWGNSNSPALSENNHVEHYDSVYIDALEDQGYVEPIESFLATDITGRRVYVVRNREYNQYMNDNEGDHLLEPDEHYGDR